jgi:NNP family nitrate/nitrite transporter-like MFS transporter
MSTANSIASVPTGFGAAIPGDAKGASSSGNSLQLALATLAFGACFATFGSLSAMMPDVRKLLSLSETQKWMAIAIPVLLGSLGRIPLGVLTDRLGGRLMFSLTMVCSIIPVFLLAWVTTFPMLLVCGFLVGIGLASFSVGAAFVSPWYPPKKQGMALGDYGAGNVGQAAAAFFSPLIVAALGYRWGFWVWGVAGIVVLIVFLLFAKDAPRRGPVKQWADFLRPLAAPQSWMLGLYYFLTFGGFVAMSLVLPTFLTEVFNLTKVDAGFRTAGFVVLATAMRPIGGILGDRVGGARILAFVFPATALFGLCMTSTSMVPFTIGALGMATAIGLGNGAVFKLVPQYFPQAVGSVTGLVGAAGGLGGFFPPLVLGVIRQSTGSFTGGFVLLSGFSILCLIVLGVSARRSRAAASAAA